MFDTDSIANRLALIFFAITLGAMAIVYVGVVPRLESSLVDERATLLQADGERLGASINSGISRGEPVTTIDREVRDAADRANARVTLIGAPASTGGEPFVKSDSNRRADIGELRFPAALATIASGKVETATESLGSERFVETAIPLYSTNAETGRRVLSNVLVLSSPLNDVEKNVTLVRDRILLATVIALIAALLAGYLVARAFGRRVGRLEQTARRVAAGDFSARFVVDGDDELGRLARALDEMQGQLAELESARRRFIATASHELRTPIFSLGGFVELLEDEDLDEETRDRFLAQLREGVDRLGKLTTDLLDLSRIDAGAVALESEPTDVGELAEAVAGEFVPALAGHESRLEIRLPGEPVQAICDPERLAQVVRILVDNAVAHTAEGTDAVIAVSRKGRRARIAVTDFGPGVPRGEIDRVFEPFYTSDGTRGAGLGLAIAHELTGRMDGELTVESRPGRTTFVVELPGAPAPAAEPVAG